MVGLSQKANSLYHNTLILTNVMHLTTFMEFFKQHLQSFLLKAFHLDIKDDHALNSHLGSIQTTSSKTYFLLSIKSMVSPSQNGDPELLKSFHSDMEDGHQLNSYLEILQTSSSSTQTPVFMSRNLIG